MQMQLLPVKKLKQFIVYFLTERSRIKLVTFVRAMKDSTATAVNMMVGINMTTAEPTLVLKKVMVASQPLVGTIEELVTYHSYCMTLLVTVQGRGFQTVWRACPWGVQGGLKRDGAGLCDSVGLPEDSIISF